MSSGDGWAGGGRSGSSRLNSNGAPRDGGGFSCGYFSTIGKGIDGFSAVRGPWAVVQGSEEVLQGSDHGARALVHGLFIFAPDLEWSGGVVEVGSEGEQGEFLKFGEQREPR